jgi:hypothetical protein
MLQRREMHTKHKKAPLTTGLIFCSMRPRSFFQYVIGSFVQLAPSTPMQRVIWRGKQVVPSITGRQPYEVPVYRFDNEH